MSTDDDIFLAAIEPVDQVAQWLAGALDLEPVQASDLLEGEHLFRGHARTAERELVVLVAPNGYIEVDPEPDEVQAIDPYPIDVRVRLLGRKDEDLQLRETRAAFAALAESRPDIAMLLVHNLDTLVAAHLPGAGTHTFDEPISPDAPDIDTWRPWVVT
ncbi:hypothetical protein ACGFIF_37215 [Kribbella sp. NPDC049174]|uniref:hypothetical protein n=1 Tax=Kribbella sp. NPDC049174 TaxID=3364112 RepID=UPI0037231501